MGTARTGRGGVVSINHVIKNNGCELDGLVIMEEGKHISPTIYLNGFYKQYQNGRTVEDIVREILHIYNENKDNSRRSGCLPVHGRLLRSGISEYVKEQRAGRYHDLALL